MVGSNTPYLTNSLATIDFLPSSNINYHLKKNKRLERKY